MLKQKYSITQQSELIERDRKMEALLYSLAQSLTDAGHQWSNEQRRAFDWALAEIESDQRVMAQAA